MYTFCASLKLIDFSLLKLLIKTCPFFTQPWYLLHKFLKPQTLESEFGLRIWIFPEEKGIGKNFLVAAIIPKNHQVRKQQYYFTILTELLEIIMPFILTVCQGWSHHFVTASQLKKRKSKYKIVK